MIGGLTTALAMDIHYPQLATIGCVILAGGCRKAIDDSRNPPQLTSEQAAERLQAPHSLEHAVDSLDS